MFGQSPIFSTRLVILCMIILVDGSLTGQLLSLETSPATSVASLNSILSTPMTTQTINVPANNFSVISGSVSGLADNSIYTNVDRVRAAMTSPDPGVLSASYHFKILGNSSTVVPDSDGVTRQGVVFWANMQNACNLYFLFWRTDSTAPVGTTVVGAKVQVNPTVTSLDVNHSDLIACAGVGYSTISRPDGSAAEISSNINIMDGNWHNFTVVKLGPERWRLYTDGLFAFEAYDPANDFPVDSNLWGMRLDNVEIQLYYQLTSSTSQLFSTSFTVNSLSGQAGQSISFSASVSGGLPPYTYSWAFGDGSTGIGAAPNHTYASSGVFDVIVTVQDSNSHTASASQLVTVSNPLPAPQLSASFTYQPNSVTTATTVSFTTSVTGGTSPYNYGWDLGDGASSSGARTSHLYPYPGTYTIQLTVTDNNRQSYSTSQTVTVIGSQMQPLSADFNYQPTQTSVDATVTFTAAAIGGAGPYAYDWDLGDGSAATGTSLGHLYTKAGNYTVVLTTTDSLGETNTLSKTVSVGIASTSQSQPPAQPPSNQPNGGTCILCNTSRLISTLSLLTIGLFAGGFLSVGVFLSRYHAQNHRLAAELRRYDQVNRTSGLRVKRTKTERSHSYYVHKTMQGKGWASQHRSS